MAKQGNIFNLIGSNAKTGYGRYTPKYRHLFRVEFKPVVTNSKLATLFNNGNDKVLSHNIREISVPNIEFQNIDVIHGNQRMRMAARSYYAQDDITITFIDNIPGNALHIDSAPTVPVSGIVRAWAALQQNPVDASGYYPADYKANIIYVQYDPTGNIIEAFKYHGAFIKSINDGDNVNYADETDEPKIIEVTFMYDRVTNAVPNDFSDISASDFEDPSKYANTGSRT